MKPAIQMIGKGTKLFSGVNSTGFENPKTIRQNSIPYGSFFKPAFAAANETSSHYLKRRFGLMKSVDSKDYYTNRPHRLADSLEKKRSTITSITR